MPNPSTATLLAILRRPDLQKTEFESTADYQARMEKLLGENRRIRVVVPVEANLGRYDADTEVFTLDGTALSLAFNQLLGTKTDGLQD